MLFQQLVFHIVIAGIAIERSLSLCSDSAELNDQRMSSFLEVSDSVPISSSTVPVFASAASAATGEAKPQVGGKVTAGAMFQIFVYYLLV